MHNRQAKAYTNIYLFWKLRLQKRKTTQYTSSSFPSRLDLPKFTGMLLVGGDWWIRSSLKYTVENIFQQLLQYFFKRHRVRVWILDVQKVKEVALKQLWIRSIFFVQLTTLKYRMWEITNYNERKIETRDNEDWKTWNSSRKCSIRSNINLRPFVVITNLNSKGGRCCSLCKPAWVLLLLKSKFRHDIFTFLEVAMDLTGAKKHKEIAKPPFRNPIEIDWPRQ